MSLYEILGVSPKATIDQIRAAHRAKAQQYHPDKNDEDTTEAFQAIQKAYEILKDAAKRKHYDETGEHEQSQKQNKDTEALRMLGMIFMQFMESSDFKLKDYVVDVRSQINQTLRGEMRSGVLLEKQQGKVELLLSKSKGELLEGMLKGKLQEIAHQRERCDQNQKTMHKMLELADGLEFIGIVPENSNHSLYGEFPIEGLSNRNFKTGGSF